MATAQTLCFREAYEARISGNINLDEFLVHIVAHYAGLRHQTDAEGQRPWIPLSFEDEVRELVLSGNIQPLNQEETDIIYSIFVNGFEGDIDAVRKSIHAFSRGSEYYLRPLMRISTSKGDAQLLRVCFENGFSGTGHLDSQRLLTARVRSNPSTAWLDVLYDLDFRQWRTNPQQLSKSETWRYVLYMGADCIRWWIEHGGHPSKAQGVFEHDGIWPGASSIGVLLDKFGLDWFNESGVLQLAVKNHDFETVKMLVEAGADINEFPTELNRDIREHRTAPLSALHEAVYAKSEEMIRYLVDHGAKLPHKAVHVRNQFAPGARQFDVFKDLVIELGAVTEKIAI
ncbi:hypothetical protein DE146DRAFT_663889 [Phaeosphaeria sp. MPI-PUGE-AT-0046c]|nr:hypothetical protein DE146DRAFT_663889 [Phaeosphaeria sp. MPI-PUGE-AT-0046c]